jgi:predicted transcriptional regulator
MAKISAAESQVMEAVWRAGQLTADEIVAEVGQPQGWGEATVKTLINRLLKKKALVSERSEGRTRYRALVSRADYVQGESQGLLDRLFEGQLSPRVAHFA